MKLEINSWEAKTQIDNLVASICLDHKLPLLTHNQFIELGKRTKNVYSLNCRAKDIPFYRLCDYIAKYIKTPFGNKMLHEIMHKFY